MRPYLATKFSHINNAVLLLYLYYFYLRPESRFFYLSYKTRNTHKTKHKLSYWQFYVNIYVTSKMLDVVYTMKSKPIFLLILVIFAYIFFIRQANYYMRLVQRQHSWWHFYLYEINFSFQYFLFQSISNGKRNRYMHSKSNGLLNLSDRMKIILDITKLPWSRWIWYTMDRYCQIIIV